MTSRPGARLARVIVTGQMMLDLVVIGLVVHGVINAIKVGQERQAAPFTNEAGGAPAGTPD